MNFHDLKLPANAIYIIFYPYKKLQQRWVFMAVLESARDSKLAGWQIVISGMPTLCTRSMFCQL